MDFGECFKKPKNIPSSKSMVYDCQDISIKYYILYHGTETDFKSTGFKEIPFKNNRKEDYPSIFKVKNRIITKVNNVENFIIRRAAAKKGAGLIHNTEIVPLCMILKRESPEEYSHMEPEYKNILNNTSNKDFIVSAFPFPAEFFRNSDAGHEVSLIFNKDESDKKNKKIIVNVFDTAYKKEDYIENVIKSEYILKNLKDNISNIKNYNLEIITTNKQCIQGQKGCAFNTMNFILESKNFKDYESIKKELESGELQFKVMSRTCDLMSIHDNLPKPVMKYDEKQGLPSDFIPVVVGDSVFGVSSNVNNFVTMSKGVENKKYGLLRTLNSDYVSNIIKYRKELENKKFIPIMSQIENSIISTQENIAEFKKEILNEKNTLKGSTNRFGVNSVEFKNNEKYIKDKENEIEKLKNNIFANISYDYKETDIENKQQVINQFKISIQNSDLDQNIKEKTESVNFTVTNMNKDLKQEYDVIEIITKNTNDNIIENKNEHASISNSINSSSNINIDKMLNSLNSADRIKARQEIAEKKHLEKIRDGEFENTIKARFDDNFETTKNKESVKNLFKSLSGISISESDNESYSSKGIYNGKEQNKDKERF